MLCRLLLLCFCLSYADSQVFDKIKGWLFGPKENIEEMLKKNVKFEIVSTDRKFLKFAHELNEMSPLDTCYHIVVFSLKKRCGELTEEELNKLAVQLLNCQSQTEGRPVFSCTSEMTLADCTRDMDGPTWNAYQIVGNRARAMCYATQQDQFRRLTEMTVNDLVSAANDQLQSMELIKNSQESLHDMATDTIRKLYESQQEMLGHHQQLQISQDGVMSQITNNMESLKTEKALIATGNKELADQTKNIKKKLEEAMKTLENQNYEQKSNHQKIIQDLMDIQMKAQDTIDKLGPTDAIPPKKPKSDLNGVILKKKAKGAKKRSPEELHEYLVKHIVDTKMLVNRDVFMFEIRNITTEGEAITKLKDGFKNIKRQNAQTLFFYLQYGLLLDAVFNKFFQLRIQGITKITWSKWLLDNVGIHSSYSRRLRDCAKSLGGYHKLYSVGLSFTEIYRLKKELVALFESSPEMNAFWTQYPEMRPAHEMQSSQETLYLEQGPSAATNLPTQ